MVSDRWRPAVHGRLRKVLILVLMEYGLWHTENRNYLTVQFGLNPCSNGIWSLTCGQSASIGIDTPCLNPCSNGIWSLTVRHYCGGVASKVLILVLMEYGLWQNHEIFEKGFNHVLILVLMEYGLWQDAACINTVLTAVLILVLMEYGLWRDSYDGAGYTQAVLILVLMEYGLWRNLFTFASCKMKS